MQNSPFFRLPVEISHQRKVRGIYSQGNQSECAVIFGRGAEAMKLWRVQKVNEKCCDSIEREARGTRHDRERHADDERDYLHVEDCNPEIQISLEPRRE